MAAEGHSSLKPPTLDLSVDRYAAFKSWKEKWNDYVLISGLEAKEATYQAAMLRYTFSDETRQIYESLGLSEDERKNSTIIIDKMETFARGIINETLERHKFFKRKQEEGETFDEFLTELRLLSKNCNFCATNGCFEGLLFCKFCGRKHTFGRDSCPAWGKRCRKCNELNHFENVCTKRDMPLSEIKKADSISTNPVTRVQESLSAALFLGSIGAAESLDLERGNKVSNCWEILIPTQTVKPLKFKIDTGAEVSVISEKHLKLFKRSTEELKQSNKILVGPNQIKLQCYGYFYEKLCIGKITNIAQFFVCQNVSTPLFGKPELEKFELIELKIPQNHVYQSCNSIEEGVAKFPTGEEIKKDFPSVFNGLGLVKGEPVSIQVNEGTTPYHIGAPRRVAIPMLKPLKEELERMVKLEVIEPVDEPTEWCHPMVLVRKPNGNIRVCIDLTKLNNQTNREFYELPSVDETLAKLGSQCKFMAKLDANSGYWQLPMDQDSKLKCTFTTPFGRFCPTRAPFGLTSLPEIFSKRMDQVVNKLGVAKSMDDFLVFGSTFEEYMGRLRALLKKFEEEGLTLNSEKCVFNAKEVEFLGHVITSTGIKPVNQKLEALTGFPQPSNITELRSFLGMAQQMSKFCPRLVQISESLRELLSSKTAWLWEPCHTTAFNEIKQEMSKPPTLALYDVNRPTKVRTDGSKLNGLSVIVLQKVQDDWQPVDCTSRFLTKAEKNYYPIELELLAITWGIHRMSKYLHGLPIFTVETDHKPLIPILNTHALVDMSPRIQRLRMKLLQCRFNTVYIRGKDNIDADALSRAPVSQPNKEDQLGEEDIECHVNLVIDQLPATPQRIKEIQKYTANDEQLAQLKQTMIRGWPKSVRECQPIIQPFWAVKVKVKVKVKGHLTEIQGLIFFNDRVVIPKDLRRDILQKLHTGHLGIEKCKRRARESVFWPNINNEIEQVVRKCEKCLNYLPSKPKENMLSHEVPSQPWQKVESDLFSYGNQTYIIVVDYYSLWPEVYLLNQTDSSSVIEVCNDIFSRHGIPEQFISDNGSQYHSKQFRKFMLSWGIKHITSSPRYPQSNGLAEVTVKNVKRLLKKCGHSTPDFYKGLLAIRNTPLTCGKSPAQLLTGRTLVDELPRKVQLIPTRRPTQITRNIAEERRKATRAYDKSVPFRNQQHNSFHQASHYLNHKSITWRRRKKTMCFV